MKNEEKLTEPKRTSWGLPCMHRGNPRGEEGERDRKNIWRNNGWKLPKFDERYESVHLTSSVKTKQDKLKNPRWDIEVFERPRQKMNIVNGKRDTLQCKGSLVKLSAYFSSETIDIRRQINGIYIVIKEKPKSRILFYKTFFGKWEILITKAKGYCW